MLNLRVIFLLACVLFYFDSIFAQNLRLKPKLRLYDPIVSDQMLNNYLFEDPSVFKIKDNLYLENTISEIEELKGDLLKAKNQKKTENLKEILKHLYYKYLTVQYYYQDILNNEIESYSLSKKQALLKFKEALNAVRKYAYKYALITKNDNMKDHALYHYYINTYLINKNIKYSLNKLNKLKKLNTRLKTNVMILKAIYDLEYANNSKKLVAINTLKTLLSQRWLSRKNKIIINLIIAKHVALLSSKGITNKDYKKYLYKASQLASGLSEKHRIQYLQSILNIWVKAQQGRTIKWINIPIYTKGYQHLDLFKAIKERQGIEYFNKKDYNKAFTIYKKLSDDYYNTNLMIEFDRNLVSISYAKALKSNNFKKYSNLLSNLMSKYESQENFMKPIQTSAKQFYQYLNNLYSRLVFKQLNLAKSSKATTKQRVYAIELANQYLTHTVSDKQRNKVLLEIATIYQLNNQYAKALQIYLTLEESTKDVKERQQYLIYAVRCQSIIAKWPQDVPWGKQYLFAQDIKYSSERTTLANLYIKLLETNTANAQWIAHLGILQIHLEQKDAAFDLWYKSLQQYGNSSNIQWSLISGYMLHEYLSLQNWEKLEILAKLSLIKGIIPRYLNKTLNLKQIIATALLEGGKQALEQKQYKIAIQKFNEFINSYPTNNNIPNVHYLLSHAYKGDGQHANALEQLELIVKNHKQSQFYKQALYIGTKWAIDMALEDKAMLFSKLYINQFKDTKESFEIREILIDLSLAQGFYDVAISLLIEQASSKGITIEQKSNLILQVLDLKYSYDSIDNAFSYSLKIPNKLLQHNELLHIKVLTIQAQYYYSKKQASALAKLEQRCLNINNPIMTKDVLSMIRFFIAEIGLNHHKQEIFSLELKDPLLELKNNFTLYNQFKEKLNSVCDTEPKGTYCPKALFTIARKAESFITLLESIDIAETLDDKIVSTFKLEKDKMLETLSADLLKYDEKAYNIIQEGTLPQFANEILWNYRLDFNFINLQNDISNGYLQINF